MTPRSTPIDIETITTVALGLFNERGYHGTSMELIASRLGVTKPALYHHAPRGKVQILEHAMHRTMDPLWLSLQEPAAVHGSSADRLRHVLTRQVELVLQGMPAIGYFLLPMAHHPLSDDVRARRRAYDAAIRGVFEQAVADGEVRADLDPAVTPRLVLGMVYSMNEWYRPDGALSPDQIRDIVLEIVFAGIRPHGRSTTADGLS